MRERARRREGQAHYRDAKGCVQVQCVRIPFRLGAASAAAAAAAAVRHLGSGSAEQVSAGGVICASRQACWVVGLIAPAQACSMASGRSCSLHHRCYSDHLNNREHGVTPLCFSSICNVVPTQIASSDAAWRLSSVLFVLSLSHSSCRTTASRLPSYFDFLISFITAHAHTSKGLLTPPNGPDLPCSFWGQTPVDSRPADLSVADPSTYPEPSRITWATVIPTRQQNDSHKLTSLVVAFAALVAQAQLLPSRRQNKISDARPTHTLPVAVILRWHGKPQSQQTYASGALALVAGRCLATEAASFETNQAANRLHTHFPTVGIPRINRRESSKR